MNKYKLSPSSAGRFLYCTASLPHNQGFTESEVSLLGNLGHLVAQLRLEQVLFGKDNNTKITELMNPKNKYKSNQTPGLEVSWNDDLTKTVDNYVSYVISVYKESKPKQVFLEYRIKMTFHGNLVNGVIDCVMILENGDIIIIDLKTGRTKVETEDNNQMLMYAFGVIQDLNKKTNSLPENVIISISQSLINNTQAFRYSLSQMVKWYENQSLYMWEINNDTLVYRPRKDVCKYCQFKDKCVERIKEGVVV